jgi:hypothetical protein
MIAYNCFQIAPFRTGSLHVLKAATGPSEDALKSIRDKIAANPSYNPMSDPQAMQVLESMIPDKMKEVPNAIERLKVSIKDATTGKEAVSDLNSLATLMPKEEAISSPRSNWFKNKFPEDKEAFSKSKQQDLLRDAKSKYPDVPAS